MISQIQAAAAALATKVSAVVTTPAVAQQINETTVDQSATPAIDKASFSRLASQLNESTARAAKREAEMSHAELGKYGKGRIDEFLQETPKANSFTRAMEVPSTNDPELLDRARKASEFVSRTIAGDKHAKSPFDNLSREQLNVIAYDDSGMFTQNERRAAWHGVQRMDDAWHKVAIPQGSVEQIRTGNATTFYREALSYYKSLPAIEKAVSYPKDAEATLNALIKNHPTLPGTSTRQAPDRKLTLYDILAGIVDPKQDKASAANAGDTKKFTPRTSPVPVTWTEAYMHKRAQRAAAPNPVGANSFANNGSGDTNLLIQPSLRE